MLTTKMSSNIDTVFIFVITSQYLYTIIDKYK